MYATSAWIALLSVCAVIELVARYRPRAVASLERIGARIATRITGRLVLWGLWIFIGVHLFTRYTLPR